MANAKQRPDAAALRRELGYITPDELHALLGISAGTGKNRQSAGTLPPHYKLGAQRVFKIAEVDAWIARRRVKRSAA